MQQFRLVALAVALGFIGAAPLAAQEAAPKSKLAQHEEVASAIRLLEAWIESQMAYRSLPGMSIAIVHDQDLVWSKGYGYADVEKKVRATPGTVYRIASISKVFTSVAVLQLRDQGKLKLDDPVEKHLSWFRLKNAPADAPPITIRQLLTHTAGLPREAAFPYWSDFKFPTREEMRKALPTQEAAYPPETKWKYSNLGLALAGEIVAEVSGQPFEAYVQKNILTPLGMTGSTMALADADRKRLSVGYGRRLPEGSRAIQPFTDARGITPAAGMASTVEDLARFASFQMREGPEKGTPVLKETTRKEMQRVHWLMPDWKSGRGLGLHIIHRGDGDLIGHGGWVAGYQTAIYFRPKDKVAVVAMFNADDGLPYPGSPHSVVDRAFQWVGAAIANATAPVEPPKAKPEWRKYVGKYRSIWGDSQVLILNRKLVMINPTEQDPLGSMSTLVPAGEHRFRLDGGSPSGPHGEIVVFELGKDDKVSRVKVGENFALPYK